MNAIDYGLFKLVNGLSGNAIADRALTLVAQNLATVLMAVVALTFLIPWQRRRTERRRGAILGTAAAGLALLVAQPLAHLVLAVLLSLSRVYVGTHYPGDVLAGALLGAGMAGVLYLLPSRKAIDLVVRAGGSLADRVLVRPRSAA
jgi:membrane-associated phospholipid phosphatase